MIANRSALSSPPAVALAVSTMVLAAALLAGCKVVTIEQDRALRARHGAAFDATAVADRMWQSEALPALRRAAVPMPALLQAIDAGVDRAGARLGRRASEGAPWTFVGRGEGVVTAVETGSRQRIVELAVAGRAVRLQVGPVVLGTTIRDALPFVTFNDYPDQLAFAGVGRALTQRSLTALQPRIAALRPGMHVVFSGAFNLARAEDIILITPVVIEPAVAHAG